MRKCGNDNDDDELVTMTAYTGKLRKKNRMLIIAFDEYKLNENYRLKS